VSANSVSYGFNGGNWLFSATFPGLMTRITNKISTIDAGGSSIALNATVANDPHSAGVISFIIEPNGNCQDPPPGCQTLSDEMHFSVVYRPTTSAPTEILSVRRCSGSWPRSALWGYRLVDHNVDRIELIR
jgi:hypothetical protein